MIDHTSNYACLPSLIIDPKYFMHLPYCDLALSGNNDYCMFSKLNHHTKFQEVTLSGAVSTLEVYMTTVLVMFMIRG